MYSASPRLQDLLITANSADCDGGGLYCEQSSPLLERVRFTGNYAEDGAALHCYFDCHPVLRFCVFESNTAERGGAIFCCNDSDLLLYQTTFYLNSALYGGALLLRDNGNALLENCILWNNTPEEVFFFSMYAPNSVEVSCSDLTGGEEAIETSSNGEVIWSEGNIDLDPLFCDPEASDFRLADDSPCRTDICGFMGQTGETCEGEGVPDAGAAHSSCHPQNIELLQNYPNPFNPTTTIEFTLLHPGKITLAVYNTRGQKVAMLANGIYEAGMHRIVFNTNAGAAPSHASVSGLYLYQLTAGAHAVSRKMLLIK